MKFNILFFLGIGLFILIAIGISWETINKLELVGAGIGAGLNFGFAINNYLENRKKEKEKE